MKTENLYLITYMWRRTDVNMKWSYAVTRHKDPIDFIAEMAVEEEQHILINAQPMTAGQIEKYKEIDFDGE